MINPTILYNALMDDAIFGSIMRILQDRTANESFYILSPRVIKMIFIINNIYCEIIYYIIFKTSIYYSTTIETSYNGLFP